MLRFIERELGQNDEAAVTSASGQIGFLQQFTDNHVVLRAAVERLKPRASPLRDGQNPRMSEVHALAIDRRDPDVLDYFVTALMREIPGLSREQAESMVSSRAREILRQSQYLTDNTLRALESAVRSSATLPGRKLIFFISDGFHIDAREGTVRDRMRRITDAAARAGVVIYSMEAAGLRTGMPDAASSVPFDPGGRLVGSDVGELRGLQEPLHTLAADTGGRALINTNAMNTSVTQALRETARYYLLAWRPEAEERDRGAPKFRRIEVSVRGRTDLNVVVRRGFYAGEAPPDPDAREREKKRKPEKPEKPAPQAAAPADTAAERELSDALSALRPRASIPTALALGFVNSPREGTVLTAAVGLDRAAFGPAGAPQADGTRVDLRGIILDDRGQSVTGFRHTLAVGARETTTGPRPRVMYAYQFKLAPGLYQVRVAARDQKTGRTGSAMEWVEIPDLARKEFTLSSIFLAERTGTQATEKLSIENLTEGVLLNVDGRFARSSWLRFVLFIYNASKGTTSPDVALQVQIFRDDQPVFTAPLIKVRVDSATEATQIPYAAELPLSSFPPGRYALQLTAIDRHAKATATRRVNFELE
jgi:VWFA-related protein